MGSGITWYDILGVTPGANSETIRRAYEAKAGQLAPSRLSGAPPDVLAAAARARTAIEAAWSVLSDPTQRQRYDDETGIRRKGEGLVKPEPTPSRQGLGLGGAIALGALGTLDPLGALEELAAGLAPVAQPPRRSRHVAVPDLRGLFFAPAQNAAAKVGFRIRSVRMAEHPMPVEGLVVGQSPPPGEPARRGDTLTRRSPACRGSR